eukprot:1265344-Pleurochrysis_carterae.AAC.1
MLVESQLLLVLESRPYTLKTGRSTSGTRTSAKNKKERSALTRVYIHTRPHTPHEHCVGPNAWRKQRGA